VLLAVLLVAAVPANALAAQVTRSQARAIAKRTLSHYTDQRYGLNYPPSAWTAACYRASGGKWRCEAGTGGQCSGALTVHGSAARPRTRNIEVRCFVD